MPSSKCFTTTILIGAIKVLIVNLDLISNKMLNGKNFLCSLHFVIKALHTLGHRNVSEEVMLSYVDIVFGWGWE